MNLPTFSDFFHAVHRYEPFPWQTMLANHVRDGTWRDGFPDAVDLPTASGKTACLDIAVYALAAQAEKPLDQRNAARRVWFVVDRRIVVDEAFERAEKLAKALENSLKAADSDPVRAVAERLLGLRGLPNRERPLAVGRLRGGVLRDDGWARIPSQASIITSTVDQLGSRLLFRGYGHSALSAPIFAGLAGNDSLILLDEAHCAVPFLQTLRAVKRFRSAKWSEEMNPTPFHVAVLSATPPGGEESKEKPSVFPADEEVRAKALDHDLLRARLAAAKRAVLKLVKSEEKLAAEIANAAAAFVNPMSEGVPATMRVGVIVNRVGRAAEIAAMLAARAREKIAADDPPAFDVHLLTGRIRPFERDEIVGALHPILHSSSTEQLARPVILVSTQCLEVGADFSFDALVTECASLDALRQRFGRLARLGKPENSEAVIVAAEDALKEPDPIYGTAMKATWEFLSSKAQADSCTINFGFEALRSLLPPPEDLLAPTTDAPILLPAHLDLLCQTAPMPHPNPDIGIFLHGKGRTSAEVRVAFRCDFDPQHPEHWAEIASLCPPISGEMFSVPLYRLSEWLKYENSPDESWDVEGENENNQKDDPGDNWKKGGGRKSPRKKPLEFLIVDGRDKSTVSNSPQDIYPDATILLSAPRNEKELKELGFPGQMIEQNGMGREMVGIDLWERALARSGKPAALRLHRECLAPWLGEKGCPPLRELMELIENKEMFADDLRDALAAVREWHPEDGGVDLPPWLRTLFEQTKDFDFRKRSEHPGGGLILCAKTARKRDEPDYFAEDEFENDTDAASDAPKAASLAVHCDQVARAAAKLAGACLDSATATVFQSAGHWHDAGKLDKRFQDVLLGGAPYDGPPLAKSPDKPRAKEREKEVKAAAGLPDHFRHEMLSLQLAKKYPPADLSENDRTLLLHLIASHHGHARPFAPVCDDPVPPTINSTHAGTIVALTTAERAEIPAHRLDSGIADRFWQMTRRFGWWGIAYREAILRLADWHASERPDKEPITKP
jgi:CRISPR-associated endonuclease/helicase Cas3